MNVYNIEVRSIEGDSCSLEAYRGKIMLIVNVASKCGFTSQYSGLERLYKKYADQGLVVLGFPCNQFGGQEPGSEEEVATFCELNYGVTFPMFAKIKVNGSDAHPLFAYLKTESPGLLGSAAIKWNFTKFLVGTDGQVLQRFAPAKTPNQIEAEIVRLLAEAA